MLPTGIHRTVEQARNLIATSVTLAHALLRRLHPQPKAGLQEV